ncbi:Vacuolar protein sorting-associated protein 72-like protein [Colletotrichum chlorophyti]|uniref:Vacuolar protein sorting-associated protein 72-like protein n=1 Tax=Colletotrichum chlorophyti TaxID=708187 RepID=A0A1Q8RN82_9PEZI|nr:Vacuolar protein sorting-associated protein 72-like protein [Colletotrichum chlorophyti]
MAATKDSSKASSRDDSSDSESDSDTENATPMPVEWLATGRTKRSTAGNRMKSMLANEEPDSDLELLFAEDDNDEGFSDVDDGGSDVQMDSSSDDEDDQNQADDMEGEKELEKQAREKKAAARKRKAQDAIPAKFRKKVRIDQTAAPAPRPKKKSERTSWLPSPADMPIRASLRQTTVLSKEQLHQQMKEREAKRLKQLAVMEKKAKKLEAMKKPPMTQAERLAEAAVVEKRNSKSLNRWEVAEKAREEERLAKLAALNNRTLKGPVVTYWSGLGEWEHHLKHESHPTEVARNAYILRNFDENLIKDKTIQTQILFGRRMDRLAKPAPRPMCVITAHPARYRDPETGLPYYNAYAYKEIQRLRRGEYKWSSLLGAWVGSSTYAARGVPERFLKGGKPREVKKPIELKEKAEEVSKGAAGEVADKQENRANEVTKPAQEEGKDEPTAKTGKPTAAAPLQPPLASQPPSADQSESQEARPAGAESAPQPAAALFATPVE